MFPTRAFSGASSLAVFLQSFPAVWMPEFGGELDMTRAGSCQVSAKKGRGRELSTICKGQLLTGTSRSVKEEREGSWVGTGDRAERPRSC